VRIGVVAALDPREFRGGVEAIVERSLIDLGARGHELQLVVAGRSAQRAGSVEQAEFAGARLTRIHPRADEGYDLEFERERLAQLVAHELRGVQIAHVHHWWTLGMNLVRTLRRSVPVVVSVHDHFPLCPRFFCQPAREDLSCPTDGQLAACVRCVAPEVPERSSDLILAQLEARRTTLQAELKAADACVFPSRFLARKIAPALGVEPGRCHVIAPGVDPRLTRVAPARATAPLRVLFLGRRSAAKGTLDLVRAARQLGPRAVELVCLGGTEGPDFDQLLREQAGAVSLELAGAYRPQELAGRARRCDVCVLPTRLAESFSLVVEEALALGLPVVSSAGAAVGERHRSKAVRLLPPNDPQALAHALRELHEEPHELAAMRAAVPGDLRTSVDSNRDLEQLYRSLLETSFQATPC